MLPGFRAFSFALMKPAQQRLEPDLRAARFCPLRFPVITNVDAEAITSGDEAREALIRQVTLPVRWLDSVREMIERGVNIFVEVGPGKVLSGTAAADRPFRALLQRRGFRQPALHHRTHRPGPQPNLGRLSRSRAA